MGGCEWGPERISGSGSGEKVYCGCDLTNCHIYSSDPPTSTVWSNDQIGVLIVVVDVIVEGVFGNQVQWCEGVRWRESKSKWCCDIYLHCLKQWSNRCSHCTHNCSTNTSNSPRLHPTLHSAHNSSSQYRPCNHRPRSRYDIVWDSCRGLRRENGSIAWNNTGKMVWRCRSWLRGIEWKIRLCFGINTRCGSSDGKLWGWMVMIRIMGVREEYEDTRQQWWHQMMVVDNDDEK